MAIDFPNTPTEGQTYTIGGKTWTYTDGKWMVAPPPLVPIQASSVLFTPTGTIAATNTQAAIAELLAESPKMAMASTGFVTSASPPDSVWGNVPMSGASVSDTSKISVGADLFNVLQACWVTMVADISFNTNAAAGSYIQVQEWVGTTTYHETIIAGSTPYVTIHAERTFQVPAGSALQWKWTRVGCTASIRWGFGYLQCFWI